MTKLKLRPLNFPLHPPTPPVLLSKLCGSPGEGQREGLSEEDLTCDRQTFVVTGSTLNRGTMLFPNDDFRPKFSLWGEHFNFQDSSKIGHVLKSSAVHAH